VIGLRLRCLFCVPVLALAWSLCASAPAQEPAAGLRTRAELDAYLAANAGRAPIDALSPGARERFLHALQFSDRGLVGMDPNELADELDDAQIRAVMGLFGPEVLAHAPSSRAAETRSLERRVVARDGVGPAERKYTDWYKAMHDVARGPDRDAKRAALFDAQLAALYEPASLRRLDDHELRLLRIAARMMAMSTRAPRHVQAFQRIFDERARRDLVSTDDVRSLRDLLLTQHRFAEARALGRKYPDAKLAALPAFADPVGKTVGRSTVWRVDGAGKKLTRAIVDLAPLQIVVTASCHFSKDAARDITADALLGPLFEKRAQWLVPAPGSESVDAVRRWNTELPRAPVAMIYDRDEWSFLPHWNMPTFFIVRDGKVIDAESGWASGDPRDRAELIAMLRRNGLLPAE
jgi:hypothetical protein